MAKTQKLTQEIYGGARKQSGETMVFTSKKAKASKRWAGMASPKPPKINRNGKRIIYQDYLRSAHWHRIRKAALKYFGYRCCICLKKDRVLNVHHTHYDDLFNEKLEDLRVLCRPCHERIHDDQM